MKEVTTAKVEKRNIKQKKIQNEKKTLRVLKPKKRNKTKMHKYLQTKIKILIKKQKKEAQFIQDVERIVKINEVTRAKSLGKENIKSVS